MNSVTIQPYKTSVDVHEPNNEVKLAEYKNNVKLKLVRIESDYYFLHPAQVSDYPKERDT